MPEVAPARRVSGAWVRGVLLAFEHLGLCAEEITERAGLDYDVITDPTTKLHEDDMARIWVSAIESSGDPLFGLHAAEHLSPRRNHISMMLAVSGRTLGDGLTAVVKYQGILADTAVGELCDEGPNKKLRFLVDRPAAGLSHRLDFLLAAAKGLLDTMTLGRATPTVVRFQHRYRGGLSDYERVFGCEVLFDQPETCLVLDPETWDMELEIWDPFLRNRLESLAQEILARTGEPGFVTSVSRALEELLANGVCDLGTTAKRLALSDRTLQRRLHEEGTQFREVLDMTRKAIVEHANERGLDEIEAARLAGFGSTRALRRAVHRWAE